MEKKVTIDDVRQRILNLVDTKEIRRINRMTDKQFSHSVLGIDIAVDSMDIVQMSMELERDFSITIPEDVLLRWTSRSSNASVASILKDCNNA